MARMGEIAEAIEARMLARLKRLTPGDSKYKSELYRLGLQAERYAKLNIRKGGTGPNKQNKGLIDQGGLLNSIFSEASIGNSKATLQVGSRGVRYAATHEYGATIKPKKSSGYLTIPLARDAKRLRARQFTNTFFYTSQKGNLMLARSISGRLENLYTLKKQVKIPARPYLRPAVRKAAAEYILRMKDIVSEP